MSGQRLHRRETSRERRGRRHLLCFERLEPRFLLAGVPEVQPDGSVEVTLDDVFDQFGFQPAIFQAYDADPANGFDDALATFSVFDTGASVVTFGANDQLLYSLLGSNGIDVGVACGAVAEAVGGLSLIGHVSQPGTVLADGLHVSSLTFDNDGFPVFELGFHDPVQGEVVESFPATGRFRGDAGLSAEDDAYQGFYLALNSGPSRGAVREVVGYIGASREFQLVTPFAEAPTVGDRFLLVAPETPFVSQLTTSQVEGGTPSADEFSGDSALSTLDAAYEGLYVQFASGSVAGELRQVTDYDGATRTFHFDEPFSTAPTSETFRILQINTTAAAVAPDIQGFIGTFVGGPPDGCPAPASPTLPSLAGTPTLNPSSGHPDGLAVNIKPFGAFLDFSDFVGFEGLVIPVPDVEFQEPALGIPHDPACLVREGSEFRSICTEPVRMPLQFVGNIVDEIGQLTEAYNPVSNHVTVRHQRPDTGELVELIDQVFLFDTGAQLSVISPAQAEAFALDLTSPEDTIAVQTAGGVISDLPGYRIDSITVPLEDGATLTFKNVWVFVVDAAAGLLDGIMGMNLFNNASSLLYDPWHPDGAVLELSFFTENLFDLPFAEIIEVESNNTAEEATPLSPGQFGSGELPSLDRNDFWESPGTNEGDLVFAYVDLQRASGGQDATLSVFDRDGNLLDADDNDGPGLAPVVSGTAVPAGLAGSVYYEVREATDSLLDEYQIYVAVVDPTEAVAESEQGSASNDSFDSAEQASPAMNVGSLGASVGSGDVDFYRVLATEGSRIVAIVDNDPDGDGELTAVRVSILDPNGIEVFPAAAADGDGDAAAAGAVIRAPANGEYRIRIEEGAGGTDTDYQFVARVYDGGLDLLAADLVLTAEQRQAAAQQVVDDYDRQLAACGSDIFCQLDVIVAFQERISKATSDLIQSASVLTFAGTISGSAMPTFVNVGNDLQVSLEFSAISENGGVTEATVRRSGTAGELTVAIEVSDDTEAISVEAVVIPDGQRVSPPFAIQARDDAVVDGNQTVTITATAEGYDPGNAALEVTDFEQLSVALADSTISERGGATTGTVTRTDPNGSLEVRLTVDDESEARLPAAVVVIPDGELASPEFTLLAVDDQDSDGNRPAIVTATAVGYVAGSVTIEVLDDESDRSNVTTVQLDGADLLIQVSSGGDEPDDALTIAQLDGNLQISNPTQVFASDVAGASGDGTSALAVPLSAFSGRIIVETVNGDDTLLLDATLDPALVDRFVVDLGPGRDTLTVAGSGVALAVSQLSAVERVEIAGSGPNTLNVTLSSVLQNRGAAPEAEQASETADLVITSDEDDTVHFDAHWMVPYVNRENGHLYRVLQNASVTVYLEGPRDWQNPVNPLNVNADDRVSSFDVLVVINELNQPTVTGENGVLEDPTTLAALPDPFYYFDVDGNLAGTPFDALRIINFLNAGSGGEGEAAAGMPSTSFVPQFTLNPSASEGNSRQKSPSLASRVNASEQDLVEYHTRRDPGTPETRRPVQTANPALEESLLLEKLESILDDTVLDIVLARLA